jgi:4-aminobutyrate aminotransferase
MDWKPGAHASTFGGNPVAIAAALATMKVIENGLLDNAREVGEHILGKLADWPAKHKMVGHVRGVGLMIAVELVRDKQTKERADAERDAVVQACFRRGLLVLGCGANSVRLLPPLVVNKEQADSALGLLEEALTEVEIN